MVALSKPYIYAFICSEERIEAVQRRPGPLEQLLLEEYRVKYRAAFGRWPHGLHYVYVPGEPETVPVWFGPVAG